jgi:hypothetical protein
VSYIIGKITRKVSKQHNEYFVGKTCGMPVRASWAKKGQDGLCIFLDKEKVDFLSKQNQTAAGQGAQEDPKE